MSIESQAERHHGGQHVTEVKLLPLSAYIPSGLTSRVHPSLSLDARHTTNLSMLFLQLALQPPPAYAPSGESCCSGPMGYLKYPMRSSTARTINGSATVASSKTSANFPPSSGGTNLPQETASMYVLPLRPPQWTGSGQMRTP